MSYKIEKATRKEFTRDVLLHNGLNMYLQSITARKKFFDILGKPNALNVYGDAFVRRLTKKEVLEENYRGVTDIDGVYYEFLTEFTQSFPLVQETRECLDMSRGKKHGVFYAYINTWTFERRDKSEYSISAVKGVYTTLHGGPWETTIEIVDDQNDQATILNGSTVTVEHTRLMIATIMDDKFYKGSDYRAKLHSTKEGIQVEVLPNPGPILVITDDSEEGDCAND